MMVSGEMARNIVHCVLGQYKAPNELCCVGTKKNNYP